MHFRLPILTCAEAKLHEDTLFHGHPNVAESAMRRAGLALGKHLAEDAQAFLEPGEAPQLVLLLGKGNNAGDAIYAAAAFTEAHPEARVILICCWNPSAWSDAVYRAYEAVQNNAAISHVIDISNEGDWEQAINDALSTCPCPITVDGIFGMSFQPPVSGHPENLLNFINAHEAFRLRVAVDIPSGLSESTNSLGQTVFQSDLTYATGILKTPVTQAAPEIVGRLRMIDLDFFNGPEQPDANSVCTPNILKPTPRAAETDKRTYGHVFIVAGSRRMPGALFMATAAAIRSGTGLVTVCAPESLCAVAAARFPEAMWIPAPETFDGDLSLPALEVFREHISRASSLLIGPGMGRFEETQLLIESLIREAEDIPLVLDADALQPRQIEIAAETRDLRPGTILTPHAGEWARIHSGAKPQALAEPVGGIVIEKGPRTWVHSESDSTLIPFGNPVLARGGSGDILAGLVAGQVAAHPDSLDYASCYAAALHGRAADRLAIDKGEQHVGTTDLLGYL